MEALSLQRRKNISEQEATANPVSTITSPQPGCYRMPDNHTNHNATNHNATNNNTANNNTSTHQR